MEQGIRRKLNPCRREVILSEGIWLVMSACDQNLSVNTPHPHPLPEETQPHRGTVPGTGQELGSLLVRPRVTTGDWEFTVIPCPKGCGTWHLFQSWHSHCPPCHAYRLSSIRAEACTSDKSRKKASCHAGLRRQVHNAKTCCDQDQVKGLEEERKGEVEAHRGIWSG